MDLQRLENYDQWQQTRFLSYVTASPYLKNKVSIWDFMPLPGDPTPAEREEMQRREQEKMQAEINDVIKYYEEQGFDLKDFKFSA